MARSVRHALRSTVFCRLVMVAALACAATRPTAAQATFQACAQPVQFGAPVCQTETGVTAPTLAEEYRTTNLTWARARASSYALRAEAYGAQSGITVSQANANWQSGRISFTASPALLALIPPGESSLELLMHFNATSFLSTHPNPGIFRQAVARVDGQVSAIGNGFFRTLLGGATSTNGPYQHSFANSGFLSGLPEEGGTVSVAMPITLTPSARGGLEVFFGARVGASTLTLDQPAHAWLMLSLLDGAGAVTLTDGTPVSELGVAYLLTPGRYAVAQVVPEPGTVALVAGGLLALAGVAARRRRA